MHPRLARFSASLPVDIRLLPYDLRGSLAHARMLTQQRIIPGDSGTQIVAALREMLREAEAGTFPHDADAEDRHTLLEAQLQRRPGAGGQGGAGRGSSRPSKRPPHMR